MPNFRTLFASVLFCVFASAASAQWIKQNVNSTASFRGLSVVNEKIVWAGGTGGTVIRTIDGGKTWNVMTVPGAEKLDFRDIEAFDANTAYILSIGNGESSRIYKTVNGGKTWNLQFKNTNEKAFFDAIACWDKNRCIAMSDPVNGQFLLISTDNGGSTWNGIGGEFGPIAGEGEAAFAASGTCFIAQGKNFAYIVTGGSKSRVLKSIDLGGNWTAVETPITHGSSGSGIFSIAMYDDKNGVIVGGNYEKPEESKDNLAFTIDGGKIWKLGNHLGGYRSSVIYIDKDLLFAVGTNGSDYSLNGGLKWNSIDSENYNTVSAAGRRSIWAVGPKGQVVKFAEIGPDTFMPRFP
jgi:photosystem II stability/assembly factor-like uncharacterized protein